jgi:hypothetical protein
MVNIVSLLFNSVTVLLFYSSTQFSRTRGGRIHYPIGLIGRTWLAAGIVLYYCPKEAALALIALRLYTAGHHSTLHKAAASSKTSVY